MEDYYTIQSPDHGSSAFENMYQLQQQGVVCDIILTADDGDVLAHKVVLMATSKYFREKLSPIVNSQASKICMKGISVAELSNLIKYIYTGKLVVAKNTMDVTLEIAEILELQGIIQGFKEIVAYEESTRAPGRSQALNKQKQMAELKDNEKFTAYQEPGNRHLTTVTTKQTGLVSNVAQKVGLVHGANKEDGVAQKGYEAMEAGTSTPSTSQTGNEYNFTNINPYDQYVDVSVEPNTPSKNVHQSQSPAQIGTPPKLRQMSSLPVRESEASSLSEEQAQHQDLLAVAIETLSDAPGLLRKEAAVQKDPSEVEKAVSELELDCKEVVLQSKDDVNAAESVEVETGEETFINGKTNTRTVTLNAGVVNNEMGGQTEVYTVSLDPNTIPGQILMPRPIKRRTVKEKKAEETAKLYRQRRAELLNPSTAASKPSEVDGSRSASQQQDFRFASLSKQRMKWEMPKIVLVDQEQGHPGGPSEGASIQPNAGDYLDYGDDDDDYEDEDLSQIVPMDMNTYDIDEVTIENNETGTKKRIAIVKSHKAQSSSSTCSTNTDTAGSAKTLGFDDRSSSTKRKTRTPKKLTGSDNESSPNESSSDRRSNIPLVRTRRNSKNEPKGTMESKDGTLTDTSADTTRSMKVRAENDFKSMVSRNNRSDNIQTNTRSRSLLAKVDTGEGLVSIVKTEREETEFQADKVVPPSMLPEVRLRWHSDVELANLSDLLKKAASNKTLRKIPIDNKAGTNKSTCIEKQTLSLETEVSTDDILNTDGTEIVTRNLKRRNEATNTDDYLEVKKKQCFMYKCLVEGCRSVFSDEHDLTLHRKTCGNPRFGSSSQVKPSVSLGTSGTVVDKVTKDVETYVEDLEVIKACESVSEKCTADTSNENTDEMIPGEQQGVKPAKKAYPRVPIVTRGRAAKADVATVGGAAGDAAMVSPDTSRGTRVSSSIVLNDVDEFKTPIIYVCPQNKCMYSTQSLSGIQKHSSMEHSSYAQNIAPVEFSFLRLSCGLCKFASQIEELLYRHYNLIHPGSPIPCSVCNERFHYLIDLQQHCQELNADGNGNEVLQLVAEDGTRTVYNCAVCGYTTDRLKPLQNHLIIEHSLTLVTKHAQLNEKYQHFPIGTLLMENGKMFDPATMSAPEGARHRTRFVRITKGEKENKKAKRKPHKSSLYKLPMEEFCRELLKRHEQYLEKPTKDVQFMSSSLAQATCFPSFPQASPSIRNSRANKLYNMPRIRPLTVEPSYTVTQTGGHVVPRVDNEIEVRQHAGTQSSLVIGGSSGEPPKPGSTVLKLYKYKPPQYKEQMIIINSNGQQSIVRSKDFYQTLYEAGNESSETLEVISSLLEAGEEIEIREEAEGVVEIQNI